MIPKVGVFICHCGTNIAGVVNIEELKKEIRADKYVTLIKDYPFMCSDAGQRLIKESIRSKGLERIVIASCSPKLHEQTFRRVLEDSGLNPFLLEIANIREQCSWVHYNEPDKATKKAVHLVKAAIHRAVNLEEIGKITSTIRKAVLIIGGGVAGIQAALDLANKDIKVYLVEKSPTLGGYMAKHDKVYPTMDCSLCILAPKMAEAYNHKNITIMTLSEVIEVRGYVGNFNVKIRRKPRYVDVMKCTACGICADKCPVKVPDEFNEGISFRKAIYIPFPQSVPRAYVIDPDNCLFLTKGICKVCEKFCPAGAVNFKDYEDVVEINVGAIIVATGFKEFDPSPIAQYGYGKYRDVVTNMQFSRLIHPDGPTHGKLVRLSNNEPVKTLVFIQCVGSRDERFHRYCSKICCMASLKLAYLVKTEKNPDAKVFVCYTDMRAYGKGYEEYLEKVKSLGVVLVRGKPSEIIEDPRTKKLKVKVFDTVIGESLDIEADMVSLAAALEPSHNSSELAKILGIDVGADGFFKELHPKLEPVNTKIPGIYICGCAAGPADIPESVAQAKAAASSAADLLLKEKIEIRLNIAEVSRDRCTGCEECADACPYEAIEFVKVEHKKVAKVIELACKGCGACAVACPVNAIQLKHFKPIQILSQIEGMLGAV